MHIYPPKVPGPHIRSCLSYRPFIIWCGTPCPVVEREREDARERERKRKREKERKKGERVNKRERGGEEEGEDDRDK